MSNSKELKLVKLVSVSFYLLVVTSIAIALFKVWLNLGLNNQSVSTGVVVCVMFIWLIAVVYMYTGAGYFCKKVCSLYEAFA